MLLRFANAPGKANSLRIPLRIPAEGCTAGGFIWHCLATQALRIGEFEDICDPPRLHWCPLPGRNLLFRLILHILANVPVTPKTAKALDFLQKPRGTRSGPSSDTHYSLENPTIKALSRGSKTSASSTTVSTDSTSETFRQPLSPILQSTAASSPNGSRGASPSSSSQSDPEVSEIAAMLDKSFQEQEAQPPGGFHQDGSSSHISLASPAVAEISEETPPPAVTLEAQREEEIENIMAGILDYLSLVIPFEAGPSTLGQRIMDLLASNLSIPDIEKIEGQNGGPNYYRLHRAIYEDLISMVEALDRAHATIRASCGFQRSVATSSRSGSSLSTVLTTIKDVSYPSHQFIYSQIAN
ncbi:hypothetical protein SISSUDRAFT_1034548 [Sistotremastrum suecicum HHB10207 ss-3]|uniref:Uncharacterized protein n=1 Tax=Sistotremastrum suecicum HHB10207 ss-3 TaxID=1314776 RepID=A0A166BYP0_9AGAM|nr:hypothetical protein SISSUDRAFT_1034548 [Sistotremastrum suecicum HHB10207 ss-3]